VIKIVDYGMGNLRSVQKALEYVGFEASITSDPKDIEKASKVVLPGVGAFGDAMTNLGEYDLIDPIKESIEKGVPFLGICLGFQLLFSESEEGGTNPGLDIMSGEVKRFPPTQRVPQIGWNQIHIKRECPILDGVSDGSFFYFVHSYYVAPEDESYIVALTDYGIDYASITSKGNVFGVQFHPEKSQDLGLRILKNFGRL
jgi:glutamine amidotransferase